MVEILYSGVRQLVRAPVMEPPEAETEDAGGEKPSVIERTNGTLSMGKRFSIFFHR